MKNLLFLFILIMIPLFAVNLKNGSPVRLEPKGGAELVAIDIGKTDFVVDKTFAKKTKIEIIEGIDGDGKDCSGKVGWVYTPLLDGNKIGGVGCNVRVAPSSKSEIIVSVRPGSTVKILDEYNVWVYLTSPKISGWTYGENVLK